MQTFFFRQWRIHAGLSQRQLAQKLDVNVATVSRVETGQQVFSGHYLLNFARICGCQLPGDPLNRPPDSISIGDTQRLATTKRLRRHLEKLEEITHDLKVEN